MSGCVYKLTFADGDVYIGSTRDERARFHQWKHEIEVESRRYAWARDKRESTWRMDVISRHSSIEAARDEEKALITQHAREGLLNREHRPACAPVHQPGCRMKIDVAIAHASTAIGSRRKLAERIGVTERTIYNWTSGHRVPDLWSAMLLAALAGVSTDDLRPVEQSALDPRRAR